MPCDVSEKLRDYMIHNPNDKQMGDQFHSHLQDCEICAKEERLLQKSLDVYIQIEEPNHYPINDINVWEDLSARLEQSANPWWNYSWQRTLAVAATFAMMLGISGWWYLSQDTSTVMPVRYQIVDMGTQENINASTSGTHILWNKQQFGLSIQTEGQQGNFAAISIGMRLPPPKRDS